MKPLSFLASLVLIPTLLEAAPSADELHQQIGVDRGICVIIGDVNCTPLIDKLAKDTHLTLFVQSPNPAVVEKLRNEALAKGWLGNRVYIDQGSSDHILLADNLADAVILTDPKSGKSPEIMRVLHPGGKQLGGEKILIKAEPEGYDEWSHPYHSPDNNPQSQDTVARGPYLTQFLAKPYYGPMPEVTVVSGGRMFKAFGHIAFKKRSWAMLQKLVAFNSYNGIILWSRDLQPGFMIHRNTLIATPDTLYLGDNKSCQLIDPATGKIQKEITFTKKGAGKDSKPLSWKWMAHKDGILYALVGEQEAPVEIRQGNRTVTGWPWKDMGRGYNKKNPYSWGFGKTLVAIDTKSGKTLWRRDYEDFVDSRAMTLKGDRIVLYSHPKHLQAVSTKSGNSLWKTNDPELLYAIGDHGPAQTPRLGYSSSTYMKAGNDVIYFAGPQRNKLVAVSAKDGKMLWNHPHGNFQLVIQDDALYAMGRTESSLKFDPLTGKQLADLGVLRGNCTRATGTLDGIFTRGNDHGGTLNYNTESNTSSRLPAMRPGCQDGVLAANGQLFWGPWMCDCNHSLVGIISMSPAGSFDSSKAPEKNGRLETSDDSKKVASFSTSKNDWPSYRANNLRSAQTGSSIPQKIKVAWRSQPPAVFKPAAPVTAGGLTFIAGSDGAIRALNSSSGDIRWTAFTGGAIHYPPAIHQGRLYAGSGDGWVYAFEATSGKQLWRFRAAPIERRIPVYDRLLSTWPVNSGVLVDKEKNLVYAAAGITSSDGTYVYALDAATGEPRWENHSSSNLLKQSGTSAGVSVQGHLLLHGDKLYMAGGNVISPAIYDRNSGQCLNQLEDEWQKAPRGSELFFADGKVQVVDSLMYTPGSYIPSRYHAKYLLEAASDDVLIQGTENSVMRIRLNADGPDKHHELWKKSPVTHTSGVVLVKNAVIVMGVKNDDAEKIADKGINAKDDDEAEPEREHLLIALNPDSGETLWQKTLPSAPLSWGIAVDRDGRIVVTLKNGQVICYGSAQ